MATERSKDEEIAFLRAALAVIRDAKMPRSLNTGAALNSATSTLHEVKAIARSALAGTWTGPYPKEG